MRNLIKLTIIATLLLSLCSSFIVGTSKGFVKCYYSDVSHQKTLDVKFGFPRRQPQNCALSLSIQYIAEKKINPIQQAAPVYNEGDKVLSLNTFYCHQMTPREMFAYKHTPDEHEYSGQYKICVQSIEDLNTGKDTTMFELQISQKFDPTMMGDLGQTPLVGSTQLLDMEALVKEIKQKLSWCEVHVRNTEDLGNTLMKTLVEAIDTNYKATYLQVLFLVIYGIVWVIVVLKFKK